MRRINELSVRVEQNFDDPLHVGRELLIDYDLKPHGPNDSNRMWPDDVGTVCVTAEHDLPKPLHFFPF